MKQTHQSRDIRVGISGASTRLLWKIDSSCSKYGNTPLRILLPQQHFAHPHDSGDCLFDTIVSSSHYGDVVFESMKSTSLRPGAIWLYRFQTILGLQSVWAAADENVPVSKYKAHASEFETIWQSLSKDQRATYFKNGATEDEASKQSLGASLGIVYNIAPEFNMQDVSTQAL